jgi:hypothetical protein
MVIVEITTEGITMHRSLARSFFASSLFALAACASPTQKSSGSAALAAKDTPTSSLDDATLDARVTALRAKGPEGLKEILAEYDDAVTNGANDKTIARLRNAVDRVAAQHDAWASRLYWYSDLEKAKLAAHVTGKPILSLHLLGSLQDELSCANSRLFRIALYPNRRIAKMLDENFILHWVTERPVPKITVDFGDGRSIVRTITGNSIHWVLDSKGRPIDGIPGLYGPRAFEDLLARDLPVAKKAGALDDAEYSTAVTAFHEGEWHRVLDDFRKDLESTGVPHDQAKVAMLPRVASGGPGSGLGLAPPAIWAEEMTMTKAEMERPLVRAVQPSLAVVGLPFDTAPLQAMAQKHLEESRLDDASKQLIAAQHPRAWQSADLHALTAGELAYRESEFERTMAEEGVRNEYALHSAIHAWMASTAQLDFATLDARVYKVLFATPKEDPWLGLAEVQVLTGLDDDGATVPAMPPPPAKTESL